MLGGLSSDIYGWGGNKAAYHAEVSPLANMCLRGT
jgi:hypothetical protein